ncbi:hypothetical protein [Helicobacter suis]|uniref:hypothetical protein n=1 Tax=Helicobacter suis TaxID=104628 RepID=UPI0013D2B12B|nr:hypothetical protein [Helicobacter suis]
MKKKGKIQTRKTLGKRVSPEFIKVRKKFLLDIAILTRLNALSRKQHTSQNILLKKAILNALEPYSANNLFIHSRVQTQLGFLNALHSTLGGE